MPSAWTETCQAMPSLDPQGSTQAEFGAYAKDTETSESKVWSFATGT